MTRSAANRANDYARWIVRCASQSDVLATARLHGAFDADSARRFTPTLNLYAILDVPVDVNWPYCAELLNRKARAASRHR